MSVSLRHDRRTARSSPGLSSQPYAAAVGRVLRLGRSAALCDDPRMTKLATELYRSGKAHAGAACLLYRASIDYAASDEGIEPLEDRIKYAFNGPNSLSLHYLLGLGLELMLKAVIAALDAEVDAKFLQNEVGHDLARALDEAERRGFKSEAQHLRELVALLRDPFKKHWFRYERPEEIPLPGEFDEVVEVLKIFDPEVAAIAEPKDAVAPNGPVA